MDKSTKPLDFRYYNWDEVGSVSFVAVIVSLTRIIGISMDAQFDKYGLFGHRGPDHLFEYEPGDEEFETERRFQEDD